MAHDLWLLRDDGTRLHLIERVLSFNYTFVVHNVGVLTLVLPGDADETLYEPDRRIAVWRNGRLQRVYMIRRVVDAVDAKGVRTLRIIAYDGAYLLGSPGDSTGRIIAYYSGADESDVTGLADNLIKDVVRNNLTAPTDTARQIASTYITVQANASAGPTVTKAFAWRNALTVCQDLADAAREAGTAVYWDFAPLSEVQWEFRTSITQPGQDHTWATGDPPVTLSADAGTLTEPVLDEDWTDEVTYAYAAGQVDEEGRILSHAEDTTRSGRSIFGRREAFQDARDQYSTLGVTAAAQRRLNEGRPRSRFSGKIVDMPGCQYGLHWGFGDKLTATYRSRSFDGIVKSLHVVVDSKGRETVTAGLEVDA